MELAVRETASNIAGWASSFRASIVLYQTHHDWQAQFALDQSFRHAAIAVSKPGMQR